MIVIVDTEYTTWPGALEAGWTTPGHHREIVQIAALRLYHNITESSAFDVLVKPAINPQLSELFTDLTGITQRDIASSGRDFKLRLDEFHAFCDHGRDQIVCFNADEAVFRENCRLADIEFPFQASWRRLRPFLEKKGVTNLPSGELHRMTPHPMKSGHLHNALHDVRSMAHYMRHAMMTRELLSIDQLPTGAPDREPRSSMITPVPDIRP